MVTSTHFTRGIAAQHVLAGISRGTRCGAEQPQGPLLIWGYPCPWQGTLGQKDSAVVLGTLWRQRTLQRQGGGSSCILAPSCLPMQGAQGNPALLPPPCTQTPRQKDKSSLQAWAGSAQSSSASHRLSAACASPVGEHEAAITPSLSLWR